MGTPGCQRVGLTPAGSLGGEQGGEFVLAQISCRWRCPGRQEASFRLAAKAMPLASLCSDPAGRSVGVTEIGVFP